MSVVIFYPIPLVGGTVATLLCGMVTLCMCTAYCPFYYKMEMLNLLYDVAINKLRPPPSLSLLLWQIQNNAVEVCYVLLYELMHEGE